MRPHRMVAWSTGRLVPFGVAFAVVTGCAPPGNGATPSVTVASVTLKDVTVVDGDTVRATVGGRRERIRIVGVDAPELHHGTTAAECWSTEATDALDQMLTGQVVLASRVDEVDDRDRYGRLLRQLAVEEHDLAEQLLQQGHAVSFRSLENQHLAQTYRDLERQAENEDMGLWGACQS